MKMFQYLKCMLPKPPTNVLIISRNKSKLNLAVKEAERVVGYSTSFLNLRWLMTDEIANVALLIRKLLGTNHPLLQTARKLLMGNAFPTWGLIVLLVSKAGGLNGVENDIEKDHTAGVLNAQRVLAEVTEMIRMSYSIHKSVINIHEEDLIADLNFGNKIALLSGDFLLGCSYRELANICNHDVSEILSSALRDLVESEFISCKPHKPIATEKHNILNNFGSEPYDCKTMLGNPRAEWMYRSILGGASLLGKACQSTLTLAKHPEHIQRLGYIFGRNVALAWQVQLERETFISDTQGPFSLITAPVMLHLEQEPSLFTLINSDHVDYKEVRRRICLGQSLNTAKLLQNELCNKALDVLSELPKTDARIALENIVKTSIETI